MLPLLRNPLLYRTAWVIFRPAKFAAGAITLGAVLAAAFLYISMITDVRSSSGSPDWTRVWRYFGVVVLVIQALVAFYGALGTALSAVGEEKHRKTYEFLVTLPLTPGGKAVGLALGANLHGLTTVAALTPLGFFALCAGDAEPGRVLWFYAYLYGGFLAASVMGVALSHGLGGSGLGWLLVIVLAGAGFTGLNLHRDFTATPILSFVPFGMLELTLRPARELPFVCQPGGCHFYSWTVPWQLSPLAFEAYLAALGFVLARRKFSRPSAPPMPRQAALWAMVVFQFLLIGFLADGLRDADLQAVSLGFQLCYFLFVLFWGMMSQPDYAQLMQWAGKAPRGVLMKSLADFRSAQAPNLLAMAAMWAVCTAGLLSMQNLYGHSTPVIPGLICAAVALAFLLMYQLVVLLMAFSVRRGEKVLGFLLVIACAAVPSIFASIPGLRVLLHATPSEVFEAAFKAVGGPHPLIMPDAQWLTNLATSFGFAGGGILVFGLLCHWRLGIMRRKLPADAATPAPTE